MRFFIISAATQKPKNFLSKQAYQVCYSLSIFDPEPAPLLTPPSLGSLSTLR